jgi:hypothetical protein
VVDLTKPSFPLVLQIYDRDGGLRGDDDIAYISPDGGEALTLQVTPDSQSLPTGCQISGPISGRCGDHLVSSGPNIDDSAEVQFTVDIVDLSSVPLRDWDIVPSSGFDINHLLSNPEWGWQTHYQQRDPLPDFDDCPSIEACTQQFPVEDAPAARFPGVCHFNLLPGSADGHRNYTLRMPLPFTQSRTLQTINGSFSDANLGMRGCAVDICTMPTLGI